MVASVAAPAWTIMMIRRGRSREATNSAISTAGRNEPSAPWAAIIASVRARLRLYRATVYPRLAKLRARLLPITARPTTPTSAFWFETEAGAVLVMLVNSHGVRGALGPPPSLAPAVVDRAPVPGCGALASAPRHWVRNRVRRGFTRSGNS